MMWLRRYVLQSQAPPDLLVIDQTAVLDVLDAFAQVRHRVRVAQDVERLDDALEQVRRHDDHRGLPPQRDGEGVPRHPRKLLRQGQEPLAGLRDRQFSHILLLMYIRLYKEITTSRSTAVEHLLAGDRPSGACDRALGANG